MKIFSWREKDLSHLDSCTSKCDNEVQCIIHSQAITNRLSDTFNDATKVTKSHIPIVNTLVRIHVPEEHEVMDNNVSHLNHDRPIRSKNASHHKKGEK